MIAFGNFSASGTAASTEITGKPHWLVEALTGTNGTDLLLIAAFVCIAAFAAVQWRKINREG